MRAVPGLDIRQQPSAPNQGEGCSVTVCDRASGLGTVVADSAGKSTFAMTGAVTHGTHVINAASTDPAANMDPYKAASTEPTFAAAIPAQCEAAEHSIRRLEFS
jgi:hypothetical protein